MKMAAEGLDGPLGDTVNIYSASKGLSGTSYLIPKDHQGLLRKLAVKYSVKNGL